MARLPGRSRLPRVVSQVQYSSEAKTQIPSRQTQAGGAGFHFAHGDRQPDRQHSDTVSGLRTASHHRPVPLTCSSPALLCGHRPGTGFHESGLSALSKAP